jgi:putative FmdB family regulatory protein
MPTYGYRCKNGHEFEVVQTFAEAPIKRCQVCGAKVNRIFYPVGIVFKGPGFYATDSRNSSSVTASADRADSDGKGKTDTKVDGKADSREVKAGKSESEGKPQGQKQGKGDAKPKSETASSKT